MSSICFAVGPDRSLAVPDGWSVLVRMPWLELAVDPASPFVEHHIDDHVAAVVDGRVFGETASTLASAYATGPGTWDRSLRDEAVVVVIDLRARRLIARRDQIGLRPLFLTERTGEVVGSTSLPVLLGHQWVDRRPDEQTLAEILTNQRGHGDRSVYRGVRRLPAGSTASVDASAAVRIDNDRPIRIMVDPSPTTEAALTAAAERCRGLLDQAVADRLDATTGVEVSGGLDSSTVASTVVRTMGVAAPLGRIVYDDPRADEREYSDALARFVDAPLRSAAPYIPTLTELDELTKRMRHPIPPINGVMTMGLRGDFRSAGCTYSLTGLGGDDAFAAMPIGSRVVSMVQRRDGVELRRLVRWVRSHPTQTWGRLVRPTLGELAAPRRSPSFGLLSEEGRALLEPVPTGRTSIRAIDDRAHLIDSGLLTARLEDLALIDEITGVRASHPYLDTPLVEFAYGLPPSWARVDGVDRSLQRRAFADRLPPEIACRTSKAEFSTTGWHYVEQPGVLERVAAGPLMDTTWIERAAVFELIAKSKQRQPGSVIQADAVLRLDAWLRSL